MKLRRKFCMWLVDLLCGEDIAWDDDNTEVGQQNDEEVIQNVMDYSNPDKFDIVVQRAFYLKKRTYVVTPVGVNGEWEAVEV